MIMPKRSLINDNKSALNVGAFYFEDAAAALEQAGYAIGSLEFTRPPGRPHEIPEDTGRIPARAYRVIRCTARGGPEHMVYDLLLAREGDYANA